MSRSSHSTLFSAGSEFEAYGRASGRTYPQRVASMDDAPRSESRSPSPADSLRFSRSSLVDPEDDDFAERADFNSSYDVSNSIDASSIGIGRMHTATDEALPANSQSLTGSGSPDVDLAGSSFSIAASSANLDDPFASEEPTPSASPGLQSRLKASHQGLSRSAFVRSNIDPPQGDQGSSAHLPSTPPVIQRSVSSLASVDTQATTRLPQKASKGGEVAELEFSEIVRGVHVAPLHSTSTVTSIMMVVVLSTKAVIFELTHPEAVSELRRTSWSISKRASVQTYKNHKGLGAIAPCQDTASTKRDSAVIIAVPGKQKGHVQILRVKPLGRKLLSAAVGAATIIVAHKSSLAAVALSPDGKLLATASSKGTLLRVWSNNVSTAPSPTTQTFSAHGTNVSKPGRTGIGATLIRELRRGTDPASILSIAFAPNGSAVAVASDKGTIHIFELSDLFPSSADQGEPRTSASTGPSAARTPSGASKYLPSGLSSLAGQIPPSMLPQYFSSEWSTAQFRIPLKTFASNARRHGVSGDGSSAFGGGAETSFGTEKSTEGAWAQMRGRVGDIRKGEAGVDETIFLCWIIEAAPPAVPNKMQRSASGSKSAPAVGEHDNKPTPENRLCLLALTTSGGWYKIALDAPSESSTVLNMYRNDAREKPRSDKIGFGCHLVEHRPILATLDGWQI